MPLMRGFVGGSSLMKGLGWVGNVGGVYNVTVQTLTGSVEIYDGNSEADANDALFYFKTNPLIAGSVPMKGIMTHYIASKDAMMPWKTQSMSGDVTYTDDYNAAQKWTMAQQIAQGQGEDRVKAPQHLEANKMAMESAARTAAAQAAAHSQETTARTQDATVTPTLPSPAEGPSVLDQLGNFMTGQAIPNIPNYVPLLIVVVGGVITAVAVATRK